MERRSSAKKKTVLVAGALGVLATIGIVMVALINGGSSGLSSVDVEVPELSASAQRATGRSKEIAPNAMARTPAELTKDRLWYTVYTNRRTTGMRPYDARFDWACSRTIGDLDRCLR
jgi:hypothetical protein